MMRWIALALLCAACGSDDSGGPSDGSAIADALMGDWHLDSVRYDNPDGSFSSHHLTDQAWGYQFDGDLNGNPEEEPATGALTYFDEGDATIASYTLHGVTLTVPFSLNPDELLAFTVPEASEERLELADSTLDPIDPRYYHEVYRRGLP
jgi:hypothetical protein